MKTPTPTQMKCVWKQSSLSLTAADSAAFTVVIQPPPGVLGAIMPMGDSITLGVPVAGGYRDPLYTLLHNRGDTFTFVGSLTDYATQTLTDAGQTHHEGHSGYVIAAGGGRSGLDENLVAWIGPGALGYQHMAQAWDAALHPDYSTWASAHGVTGGKSAVGPDGIPNLLLYALSLKLDGTNGSPGFLTGAQLGFTKRAEAVVNGDVTYAIETSPDLQDPWTVVTPDVNDGTTISYTLPSGENTIFARLKVISP